MKEGYCESLAGAHRMQKCILAQPADRVQVAQSCRKDMKQRGECAVLSEGFETFTVYYENKEEWNHECNGRSGKIP